MAFTPDDLPHDVSDLEMTWLPWRPGAATGRETGSIRDDEATIGTASRAMSKGPHSTQDPKEYLHIVLNL